MTDVRDFLPLYSETLARVRARMDADANAGLASTDPGWIDTREGSFYWDVTQVAALEIARLWDALGSETVAAAFPSVAWGDYLDEHAATFGLQRNPAVSAVGTVLFLGTPGTLVGTNTQVSAPPTDPSLDSVEFQTTESGAIAAALVPPTGVTATPATTGGSLAAGTYTYRVTAYNQFGETTRSADTAATTTGATSKVTVGWTAETGAIGYRVYRTTAPLGQAQLIADVTGVSFVDTGAVAPGALEPTVNTTAGIALAVVALQPGQAGNLAAHSITELDTVVPGVASVRNDAEMYDGADTEDDESLRSAVLAQYAGQGGGNQNDYVTWLLAYPGVERAVCIPAWAGAGTVLAVPMLADGSPVSSATVTALQNEIDPVAGRGKGKAPVGAAVTIATTTGLNINVVATVTFDSGYSLDGTSGTIATREQIVAALQDYLNTLDPGDTLVYAQLQATFFSVDGVKGISGLTVNGGTADITLGVSPPQYPVLTTPTLS